MNRNNKFLVNRAHICLLCSTGKCFCDLLTSKPLIKNTCMLQVILTNVFVKTFVKNVNVFHAKLLVANSTLLSLHKS